MWPFSKAARQRVVQAPARPVRAKYDAAQDTPDNRRHWLAADTLSPSAALTPTVRQKLRTRSRYEVANNSYARGILLTLANDTVGTGPTLQMTTDNQGYNKRIEREFAAWAYETNLAATLRLARLARAQDGETFGRFTTDEMLRSAVKLRLRLFEAEICQDPEAGLESSLSDGIKYDAAGNPLTYRLLREHPGDGTALATDDWDDADAKDIVHWFRVDRPGQLRGVPEIVPALPLFAQLRRYTLAALTAAETAASLATIMKTGIPQSGEAAEVDPGTEMEYDRNTMTFVPEGWEPSQLKAEQPTTTYDMFKRELINEIARCLNMPYNVAACNSASYNYASGRLDHQTYDRSIRVDQSDMERVILDPLLAQWLAEAPAAWGKTIDAPHQWFWAGREHVDPSKEAQAQAMRLEKRTTTLSDEWARVGQDWRQKIDQIAEEEAYMRSKELTPPAPKPASEPGRPAGDEDEPGGKGDEEE